VHKVLRIVSNNEDQTIRVIFTDHNEHRDVVFYYKSNPDMRHEVMSAIKGLFE
jgi:hypothetical protein